MELSDKCQSFAGRVDKVRLGRRQRLETDRDLPLLRFADGRTEGFLSPLPCLLARHTRHHVALFGRTHHHDLSSEIGAKMDQLTKVFCGPLADAGLWMIHV